MFFLPIVFLLFLCAATLASCETALTVGSKAKIHKLILAGNKRAILVKELQDRSGEVISTLLTCSTLIDTMIPTMTAIWAVNNFGEFGQAMVGALTTVVILTYGEAVPKMFALRNPEYVLLKTAPLLKFISKTFRFLNRFMTFMANMSFKLFRVKTDLDVGVHDELKSYIDMHTPQKSEEKSMLTSILDLEQIDVKEIMIFRSNVQMLDANDSFENIIHILQKTTFSRLPVWKDQPDNIVGIVHTKAFLEFLLQNEKKNKEQEFNILKLCSKPWFVPETTNLLDQLRAFKVRREHFALIVDEYGVFQGIVTLEDLIEEIVGDINDEFDVKLCQTVSDSGECLLPGDFTIRDLNRQFHFNLTDIEATIAGLLLRTAQKIPETGRVYEIQNVRFEIMKRHKNYISLVKVTPL